MHSTRGAADQMRKNQATANQLGLVDFHSKKDLEVVKRGIDNQMRCKKAQFTKQSLQMQKRLERINKESERWHKNAEERMRHSEIMAEKASQSSIALRKEIQEGKHSRYSTPATSESELKKAYSSSSKEIQRSLKSRNAESDHSTSARKSGVKEWANANSAPEMRRKPKPLINDMFRKAQRAGTVHFSTLNDIRTLNTKSVDEVQHKRHTVSGFTSPPPARPGSSRRQSLDEAEYGTSGRPCTGASGSVRGDDDRASSDRWSRLVAGKRPIATSPLPPKSLLVTLDREYQLRRKRATTPEPFTAQDAWKVLNTRYLRLTRKTVEELEGMCKEAGYDVKFHAHVNQPAMNAQLSKAFAESRRESELRDAAKADGKQHQQQGHHSDSSSRRGSMLSGYIPPPQPNLSSLRSSKSHPTNHRPPSPTRRGNNARH